jgi:hypothetical protein
MLKKLMLAGVAAGMLALNAPIAHAAVVQSRCGFNSLSSEGVTGGQNTFTGGAYGIAVFDDQATHTLRCYVTVDGVEQSSTPTGSGTAVVTSQGQVTYNAAEGASVELCTEIDGHTVLCAAATETTIPPDEVNDILAAGIDPIICPVLIALAPGVPGVIDISPEGDVVLAGTIPFWDCPPYGN